MSSTTKLAFILLSTLSFCVAEDSSILREQCGGTITSDSSSFLFPGNNETVRSAEICVWTILLETTRDFRFNFRHYNTNSTDCSDGGMRIYSLNNLVPSGGIESYEFCAGSPPPSDFFLSGTAVVVVIYASANNTNPGLFELSWIGNSFDPLKTTHVSSFSTATSGALRYPIVGHYEPNLVATWIVDASPSLHTTGVDFTLESIILDSCSNSDPCTCDALFLYEISPEGRLNETRRFCDDGSNINMQNIQNKFVLAFFTDGESGNSTETGFQGVYYPNDQVIVTTQAPPTTEAPIEETPCGSVIRAESGYISYKNGTAHGKDERCVWIVEIPDAFLVNFELIYGDYYWTSGSHGVQITAFSRTADGIIHESDEFIHVGWNRILTAQIAVVTFFSRGSIEGEGFILAFQRLMESPNSYVSNHQMISDVPNARLEYPSTGVYMENEFSAFVYVPGFTSFEGVFDNIKANYTLKGLDDSCNCCDFVDVYIFNWALGWRYVDTICNNDASRDYFNDEPILFLLASDQNNITGPGFTVEFSVPELK